MSDNTLMRASREWASRPDDERYLNLDDLKTAVDSRTSESWTAHTKAKDIRTQITENGLELEVYDPTKNEKRLITPSHWAFGQTCQLAGAPASYLRKLPDELAGINLQYCLENTAIRSDGLVLAQSNGAEKMRAITSESYGRIWDSQVVDAVIKANQSGNWVVPAASYATTNPKRATTLYASDRDVFIFLVDPEHPITVGDETLFRGFFVWNSETGSATFGMTTFLYRYVCDNRIVWGTQEVQEFRMRHSKMAPERFAYEGAKLLERYANESTEQVIKTITAAKQYEIPDAGQKNGVSDWLKRRGFTDAIAKASVTMAEAEEGEARSLWDIVNGITSYARSIEHTDSRVDLERAAGKLLELA